VYVELGTLLPKSGGEYGYWNTTFGSFPAFLFIWLMFVAIHPAGLVIRMRTLATYISDVLLDDCAAGSTVINKIISALGLCKLRYL